MFTLLVWFSLSNPAGALTPVTVKQFPTWNECINAMAVIHANANKLPQKVEAYSCVKAQDV